MPQRAVRLNRTMKIAKQRSYATRLATVGADDPPRGAPQRGQSAHEGQKVRVGADKSAHVRIFRKSSFKLQMVGNARNAKIDVAFFRQIYTLRASPIRVRSYQKLFAGVLRAIMWKAKGSKSCSSSLTANGLWCDG